MRRAAFHVLAALILIGCWLACFLGPLSFLGAFIPFFLAFWHWKSSRAWALAFALVNPLVLATALPAISYFRGTAALGFHGLPGYDSFNLDRETRLPRRGGGCVVDGNEWLGDSWNNFVLKALVKILGPMRGSPDGPYPAETELLGQWDNAREQQEMDLAADRIVLEGKSRTVPGLQRILARYGPWRENLEGPPSAISAKDFGAGSFALRIPMNGDLLEGSTEITVLFGGEPLRVIGYFAPNRGRGLPGRIPPVRPGT